MAEWGGVGRQKRVGYACWTVVSKQGNLSDPADSPMLPQMAAFPSFLGLNNIPLYVSTTFSLSIHLSIDTLLVSVSWLL